MTKPIANQVADGQAVRLEQLTEIVDRARAIQASRGIPAGNRFPTYSGGDAVSYGEYVAALRELLRNMVKYTSGGDVDGKFVTAAQGVMDEARIIEDLHILELQQLVLDAEDGARCHGGCTSACGRACSTECTTGCSSSCSTQIGYGCRDCTGSCAGGCGNMCTSCTGSCTGGCSASCRGKCKGCSSVASRNF